MKVSKQWKINFHDHYPISFVGRKLLPIALAILLDTKYTHIFFLPNALFVCRVKLEHWPKPVNLRWGDTFGWRKIHKWKLLIAGEWQTRQEIIASEQKRSQLFRHPDGSSSESHENWATEASAMLLMPTSCGPGPPNDHGPMSLPTSSPSCSKRARIPTRAADDDEPLRRSGTLTQRQSSGSGIPQWLLILIGLLAILAQTPGSQVAAEKSKHCEYTVFKYLWDNRFMVS